jgi:alpha-L-fucosidase
MDWHHPDGLLCKTDEEARERFLTFTHGCVEELLSRYGTIDILWYDVPSPLSPEEWRAEELNTRARELQPGIIINDRTGLPGDFATPEEGVIAAEPGRDWEVAMTMNLSWGYSPGAEQDWRSVREIIRILYSACAHSGNFLLNLGPEPDGSIPEECRWRFETVGRWVAQNRETVHGQLLRVEEIPMHAVRTGSWVAKDETTQFFWCHWWQPGELVLGGVTTPLKKVTLLATGEDVTFEQQAKRTVLKELPEKDPSPETGFNVFKLEFVARPQKTSRTAVEWW